MNNFQFCDSPFPCSFELHTFEWWGDLQVSQELCTEVPCASEWEEYAAILEKKNLKRF